MALHLNLHHEIAKQKALNRRDPLKLSLYGLAGVAACMAGYYFMQLSSASTLSAELSSMQSEFSRLHTKAEAAKKREEELSASVKLSETMIKRVEGRFYWAYVLDVLRQAVPPEVQVTKLAGDLSNDKLRRCNLTIEGISAGAEPRRVAEDLRRALTEKFAGKYFHVTSKFASLDDGKDTATFKGQQLPTALFNINLQMQIAEDEAPPAPTRRDRSTAAKKTNEGGML